LKSFGFISGIDDLLIFSSTTALLYLITLEIRNPIKDENAYIREKGKIPIPATKTINIMKKK
jgi:hypothetical protein